MGIDRQPSMQATDRILNFVIVALKNLREKGHQDQALLTKLGTVSLKLGSLFILDPSAQFFCTVEQGGQLIYKAL